MKRILIGFHIFEESKQMLQIIKDDYGVKSLSAVLNEFLYYVSHGVLMPGGNFDVPTFLHDVSTMKYVVDKESFRVTIRNSTVYDRYIESLEENDVGTVLIEKCVDMSIQEALSKFPEQRLLIQQHILEQFSDPLSKREVFAICNYWYEKSIKTGKMAELTKQQILKELEIKKRLSEKRDAEEARQKREHINYYAEASE